MNTYFLIWEKYLAPQNVVSANANLLGHSWPVIIAMILAKNAKWEFVNES